MSASPPKGTKIDSLHILEDWRTGRQVVYEWTGKSWSTPGTGWGTRPSFMAALGWKYKGPKLG